jgi:hypothetical protein
LNQQLILCLREWWQKEVLFRQRAQPMRFRCISQLLIRWVQEPMYSETIRAILQQPLSALEHGQLRVAPTELCFREALQA